MKRTVFASIVALLIGMLAISARASFFVMPVDGTLYASSAGGAAGGVSEFGTGTSPADFHSLFTGLPAQPQPTGEVVVGYFPAGTSVDFGIKTEFLGTYYAFSDDTTSPAARTSFMDLSNSLGLGGSVVQPLGSNQYLLHLDDAASFGYDDNNYDFLINLRVAPVPEPAGLGVLAISGLLLSRRQRRRYVSLDNSDVR